MHGGKLTLPPTPGTSPRTAEERVAPIAIRGESSKGPRVRLKCHWQSSIRAVNVTKTTSFRSLRQRLSNDYGFAVSLQYEDIDGDLITLSSQNDLNEMLETEATTADLRRSVTVHVGHADRTGGIADLLMSPTPSSSATQLNPLRHLPTLPNTGVVGAEMGKEVEEDVAVATPPAAGSTAGAASNPATASGPVTPIRRWRPQASLHLDRGDVSSRAYWHSRPRQTDPIR
eukprot:g1082.t1